MVQTCMHACMHACMHGMPSSLTAVLHAQAGGDATLFHRKGGPATCHQVREGGRWAAEVGAGCPYPFKEKP